MSKRNVCMAMMAAVIIMAASLVPLAAPSYDAAAEPRVTVSTAAAEPGDTVDISVYFTNATLASFRVTLEYDSDLMHFDSLKERLSDGHMTYAETSGGRINITWFSDSNISLDGVAVATVSFTIGVRTEPGTYPVHVYADNTFDKDENSVNVNTSSGAVVVTESTDAATVSVTGGPLKPSGTIDVRLKMSNAELVAFKLFVAFDPDYLTFKSFQQSSVIENDGMLTVSENNGEIVITWISSDPANNTSFNGDILTFTLEANYGVSGVRVPINISVDDANNTFDSSLSPVALKALGGDVKIVDGNTHLDVPDKNVIKDGISGSDNAVFVVDPHETASMELESAILNDLSEGQTVSIRVMDGEKELYTWIFEGTLSPNSDDLDLIAMLILNILRSTTPHSSNMESAMSSLYDGGNALFLKFGMHGKLSHPAHLRINTDGSFDPGAEVSLYYLDSDSLVHEQNATVDSDGYVTLSMAHFSEFALVSNNTTGTGGGDDMWIWVAVIAVIAAVALIGVILIRRKA